MFGSALFFAMRTNGYTKIAPGYKSDCAERTFEVLGSFISRKLFGVHQASAPSAFDRVNLTAQWSLLGGEAMNWANLRSHHEKRGFQHVRPFPKLVILESCWVAVRTGWTNPGTRTLEFWSLTPCSGSFAGRSLT
jgi:hypothetical protein